MKRQGYSVTTKHKETGTGKEARGKDTTLQPNTKIQVQVKQQEARIQRHNQTQRYRYR